MAKKKIVEEKKIVAETPAKEQIFPELSVSFNHGCIGIVNITKEGYIQGTLFLEDNKQYMFITKLQEV